MGKPMSQRAKHGSVHQYYVQGNVAILTSTHGRQFTIDVEDLERVLQSWWCMQWLERRQCWRIERIKPTRMLLSRFILNAPKDMQADHKNHHGSENVKSNLRIVTPSQNSMNCKKRSNTTCKYKGVTKSGNRYMAYIMANHKWTYLGTFSTPKEAAKTYDNAAIKSFGEYALLNFQRTI